MKQNLFFMFLLLTGLNLHAQRSGIEFFFVQDYKKIDSDCKYCIDLKTAKLAPVPLIDEEDIKHFNWKKQQIILTEKGKHKFRDLKIPLSGLPVIITLKRKKIYSLWFWNQVSSFGCDRVFTYPTVDFKIQFGLPKSFTFGTDPRFNKKLREYVVVKYKQ